MHLVARRHERTHERPTIELDPDHDLAGFGHVRFDELVDPLETRDAFGHSTRGEHTALGIFDADVVMGLGPIDPDVEHSSPFPVVDVEPGGAKRRTNGSVLEARHPTGRRLPSPTGGGTNLVLGLHRRPWMR